jgi:hypothetical protein
MDRSVIIAIWIGGGAVGLLFIAIVLTSLLRGCGETPSEPSATDAQPRETVPVVPAKSKPIDESAETKTENAKPTAAKSDADDRKPAAKKDRLKSSPKEPPSKPTPKIQGRQSSGMMIQLSAGTALAQTLPTGTAMGFSVDYEFSSGQPGSSARYLWVIEPAGGQSVKQPIQLDSQGTLQGFVQQLRPDDGPFQTYIEDQNGTKLSRSLALR